MKTFKKLLLIIITTTLSIGTYAQVADSIYYERLYYTCKAWGHAKYYHSRIAAGKVGWDDVLLNALSGIKNAPDNQSFNDSLFVMLQQAGETEGSGIKPEIPDSLNNNKDLSWIYNPIFSNEVSALLDTILQRFTPRPNAYVDTVAWGSLNFQIDNKYYYGPQYPDENKRILAVFRYWNIIHYFFPYKYIMDQDWNITLKQTIPAVVKASNALEYHLAMREFTAKINDSHAFFSSNTVSSWTGHRFAPFLASFIEGRVVITKVHPSCSEVFSGDIIKKIDDIDIDVLRDSLRKYAHGSNEITVEKNLISIILHGENINFSLTVLNETGEHTFNLKRGYYNSDLAQDNTPYWRKIIHNNCSFGIVHMGNLYDEHISEIIENFKQVDAIIFDIRNYPNGTFWTLVDYFFETSLHITNLSYPDINYPGRLFWYEDWIGVGTLNPVQKKVIILFNERTLSQAEYTCIGLDQVPGSIKIGSTTAGGDGDISYIYLPGLIATMASFLGVYYPDYTPTQRVGIIPDYEVHPTIQGIREGRDEVLEFALNCDFVGIENVSKTENLIVYPNPTTGVLNLIQETIDNEQLIINNVEVFDVYGRNVFLSARPLVHSFTITLDISHLPAGIYFMRISTETGIVTKKVIKY